jgi:hypothetical protein
MTNNNETTSKPVTGRPTKYEQNTIEHLLAGISDGLPYKAACAAASISYTTLQRWRAQYPDLEPQMEQAREEARRKLLQIIKSAAEDDWRAAARLLEMIFPQDYPRGNNTRVEVNASAGQTAVVVSAEEAQALREQRQRLLA